ncbi:MAG: NlpC/P60 family protein, partial [Bacteroidia bacterium]|nr:NlpC/P60 family protein [Bacteroidia bacterium]
DKNKGDLAFFMNEQGNIVHVGVCLDNDKIIHASVRVRIDLLDEKGIYNTEIREYTHKLNGIRRVR